MSLWERYHRFVVKYRAWKMRLYPTRAEHRAYLAIRGYTKIMRQYVAYPYIIDFYLPEWQVGIEIDGPVHWHREWYDDKRSAYLLKTYNINIYRFEHDEEGLPRFMHDLWMEHRDRHKTML